MPRVMIRSFSLNHVQDFRNHRSGELYKDLMTPSIPWSSATVFIIISCLNLAGCGSAVLFIQEGPNGGVVRYLYKEHQGPMLSSHRGEAFSKIKRFCLGPYKIVREGQTRGRSRVVEGIGTKEVLTEQWWGIRFRCQEKESR